MKKHRLTMLFAFLMLLRTSAFGAEIYSLDKEGFIKDWLLIGPYPNYDGEVVPLGFADDLLKNIGGEVAIEPYAGMKDKAVFVADTAKLIAGIGSTNEWGVRKTRSYDIEWKELHWDKNTNKRKAHTSIICLDGMFGDIKDSLVAYAACYLISPGDIKVQLRLGSDDGYKLWVNHEYIGGLDLARPAKPNDNIHIVKLNKGVNLVLMKIIDRRYDHAFCFAVTDYKGRPVPGMKVSLSNPKVRFAHGCSNLDRVDVVDEKAFAKMAIRGEVPFFPGELTLDMGVGAEEKVEANIEVLVTDSRSKPLFRKTFKKVIGLQKAFTLSPQVNCENAGVLAMSAVVKNARTGELLGHLKREVEVLSPEAVSGKLADIKREMQKLENTIAGLEKDLERKSQSLSSLRGDIAGQYAEIEEVIKRNRMAKIAKIGAVGKSINEKYVPVQSDRSLLCLNGDKWELASAKMVKWPNEFDVQAIPTKGWVRSRVPVICCSSYFRSYFCPVDGGEKNPHYGPNTTMPCGGDFKLPDVRVSAGTWYKLDFDLPHGWSNRSVDLVLNSTNYYVRVYLNGNFIAEDKAWCGPMRFAISGLRKGGNQLAVYVGSAICENKKSQALTTKFWGIMGDVMLEASDKVAVSDTWVITSYRNANITAKVWVSNRASEAREVSVEPCCMLDGAVKLRFAGKKVTLAGGETKLVEFSRPWSDPELWGIGGEYGEPVLYKLVTDVKRGGKVLDRHFTRFGFREFWICGHHFYLNGKRIFLQGDNGHFTMEQRRKLEVILPLLRKDNINIIRSHQGSQLSFNTEVLPRYGDESGMLVCAQMYGMLYPGARNRKDYLKQLKKKGEKPMPVDEFLKHPLHEENLKNYERWVKMMRNHPSVVMYSTDNEIFTQSWDTPENLKFNICNDMIGAEYGQYVKSLDPTRVITRDGDEGTWGHKGKWSENPPCDTANYHYPDFHIDDFVKNWETVFDGRPVVYGETLYHSYGAFDGWVGALPAQVANKAKKVREVAGLYKDLEIPGAIYMALSLDGFIQIDPDGCGPWRVTPEMIAEYKANKIIKSLPDYPYRKLDWPSLSGPGMKREFARYTAGIHGELGINWFDASRPTHCRNAVNDAYRDSQWPMPPLKATRAPEILVAVKKGGEAVAFANISARPLGVLGVNEQIVMADSGGKAWFLLPAEGKYAFSCGGKSITMDVAALRNDPPVAGFGYLRQVVLDLD